MRLPFRITVTQLRLGLLVVSLLLAGGIFAYASYSYYGLTKPPDVPILDPVKYRFRDADAQIQRANSAGRLDAVANWLQPSEPPPKVTPEGEEKPAAEESKEETPPEGELSEGPLGEQGYQYVWTIRDQEDPLSAIVVLAKKQEAQPGAGVRLPGGARPYTPPSAASTNRPQTRMVGGRPVPGARGTGDRISFRVRDREFRSPELNLHFRIHSADETRFVYWIPDKDGKKSGPFYALKYVPPGEYLKEPEKGLRPPPQPEAAAAQPGAPGQEAPVEKPGFVWFPREWDPDSEYEEEYLRTVEGKPQGRVTEAVQTGMKPGRDEEEEPKSGAGIPKAAPAGPAASYGGRAKPAAGPAGA
ncbi:MAG: hypothetical protein ACUVYA_13495, partial [Planctomycetota bacterium]